MEEKREQRTCRHPSPIYIVKRMRLYKWLIDRRLYPDWVQPDVYKPTFVNWVYKNTPELEDAIEEYFAQFEKHEHAQ